MSGPSRRLDLITLNKLFINSRDCSVCIATDYRLDDRVIGVRISAGAGKFSLRYHVQTCSRPHSASYSKDNGGSLSGGKAAGA